MTPRRDEPAAAIEPLDDAEAMSYEEARGELVEVVQRLEAGGVSLEESIQLWERGEALAAACERLLEGARRRLSTAQPDENDSTEG